jgi:hypothetical protein
MSIENRHLSSPMPARISVLGTGNNKFFTFTRPARKPGRGHSDNQGQK